MASGQRNKDFLRSAIMSRDEAPSHIPLHSRLAFLIRICGFRLAEARIPIDKDDGSPRSDEETRAISRALGGLREELKILSEQLLATGDCQSPIDGDLRRLEDAVRVPLATIAGAGSLDLADTVREVTEILQGVDCRACASLARQDHVCDGDQDADSMTVAQSGACFRWVLDVADYVQKMTADLYNPIAAPLGIAPPRMTFGTALRREARPHRLPHASHVTGSTSFSDDPNHVAGERQSKIRLVLSERLDFLSTLCIVYVLAHEYVCHAYQQIGRNVVGPRVRPTDCRFTEGWMDGVANLLLRQWLEEPDRSIPRTLLRYRTQCQSQIQSLFDARYHLEAPDRPANREMGVQAFQRVDYCFWYHGDQAPDVLVGGRPAASIHFSLLLNMLGTEDELELVTSGILRTLPAQVESVGYHSRSKAVREAMHSFRTHCDVKAFITDLKRLQDELVGA